MTAKKSWRRAYSQVRKASKDVSLGSRRYARGHWRAVYRHCVFFHPDMTLFMFFHACRAIKQQRGC